MQDQPMQGSHPGHLPPPSKTHGTDRVCESPSCETKLSIYNPARHCWQHAEAIFPSYRGKRLQHGGA
jgi:hypothetical protein